MIRIFFILSLLLLLPVTNALAATGGPEENAIYNYQQKLVPDQVTEQFQPGTDVFKNILEFFDKIKALFLKPETLLPNNSPELKGDSDTISQVYIPEQVREKGSNPAEDIQNDLGDFTGHYGVDIAPMEDIKTQPINVSTMEKIYQNSNYPCFQGACPITNTP